jgi:YVTN family beta-propeller protein
VGNGAVTRFKDKTTRRASATSGGARRINWRSELAYVLITCGASALIGLFAIAWYSFWNAAHGEEVQGRTSALVLEGKIPLGSVAGRIDHMSIDVARRRLFVAELGNNTVGVVDLDGKTVAHRITGLSEPQGIAYVSSTDTVFVANAGDGSARVFRGSDYAQIARIDLGSDADNVRFDGKTGRVIVGFGSGGIAVIDPTKNEKIAQVALPVHPESFQIDSSSDRIFANLSNASSIAVLSGDLRPRQNWNVRYAGNFAMTVDADRKRVLVVFRRPTLFVAFDEESGRAVAEAETCGDVDDLFYDYSRRRVYLVCGSGAVEVRDTSSDKYSRIVQIQTVAGARTGLFVPELNSLFVGIRGHWGELPAIWSYRAPGAVP